MGVIINTKNKIKLVKPCRDAVCVHRSNDDKKNNEKQKIKHLRRINFVFEADGALAKRGIELMLRRKFFNAHARSDKEKDNERLCEDIQDRGKDHKGDVI